MANVTTSLARPYLPLRTASAAAVGLAAGLAVAQDLLGLAASSIDLVVLTLLFVGILGWNADRFPLASSALVSSAILSLVLPILLSQTDAVAQLGLIDALSGMLTCLALALALERFSMVDLSSWSVENTNGTSATVGLLLCGLWAVACAVLVGSIVSESQVRLAVALTLIASAILIEASFPAELQSKSAVVAPEPSFLLACLGAIAFGSALSVLAIVVGVPFGWPLAGVSLSGLLAVVFLARVSQATQSAIQADLQRTANESRVDSLTGLTNRRGFDERLAEEHTRSLRYGHSLSLLMIDIDDFKRINDHFGHAAGDQALRSVARCITDSIRSIDIAARYGGEEFAVILPETAIAGAGVVAERIRSEVAVMANSGALTVSIGVSELTEATYPIEDLMERADTALYRAKRLGKNRIQLSI